MGAWGPAIFSDDLAADVRHEYSALLSIGKTDEEAESMLINYYSDILDKNLPDEAVFWFSLSLSEWNKGRLSDFVKEKALYYIEDGSDLKRWDIPDGQKNYQKRAAIMDDLKKKLTSDQSVRKKVKRAPTHFCPWREGSLLAYKAINCPPDSLIYNKYLLLRVAAITRSPVSVLAPDDGYDERMIVAVYGWVGDHIPDADIVKGLEFVPTSVNAPLKTINFETATLIEHLQGKLRDPIKELVFGKGARYCCDLPYRADSINKLDISLLAQDDGFDRNKYEFLKTDICSITMSNGRAFELGQSCLFEKLGILNANNQN